METMLLFSCFPQTNIYFVSTFQLTLSDTPSLFYRKIFTRDILIFERGNLVPLCLLLQYQAVTDNNNLWDDLNLQNMIVAFYCKDFLEKFMDFIFLVFDTNSYVCCIGEGHKTLRQSVLTTIINRCGRKGSLRSLLAFSYFVIIAFLYIFVISVKF